MNILKSVVNYLRTDTASRSAVAILFLFVMLCFPGCQTVPDYQNDTRTIPQLINYLKESGLKIDKLYPVRYQAILASDGIVMDIEGGTAEFYLYDTSKTYQLDKLKKIKKNKYINILGNHVPAITNGRFIMLTYSSNPNLIKIIKAFRKFPIQKQKE